MCLASEGPLPEAGEVAEKRRLRRDLEVLLAEHPLHGGTPYPHRGDPDAGLRARVCVEFFFA
jgi:hypothetical protein